MRYMGIGFDGNLIPLKVNKNANGKCMQSADFLTLAEIGPKQSSLVFSENDPITSIHYK